MRLNNAVFCRSQSLLLVKVLRKAMSYHHLERLERSTTESLKACAIDKFNTETKLLNRDQTRFPRCDPNPVPFRRLHIRILPLQESSAMRRSQAEPRVSGPITPLRPEKYRALSSITHPCHQQPSCLIRFTTRRLLHPAQNQHLRTPIHQITPADQAIQSQLPASHHHTLQQRVHKAWLL